VRWGAGELVQSTQDNSDAAGDAGGASGFCGGEHCGCAGGKIHTARRGRRGGRAMRPGHRARDGRRRRPGQPYNRRQLVQEGGRPGATRRDRHSWPLRGVAFARRSSSAPPPRGAQHRGGRGRKRAHVGRRGLFASVDNRIDGLHRREAPFFSSHRALVGRAPPPQAQPPGLPFPIAGPRWGTVQPRRVLLRGRRSACGHRRGCEAVPRRR